MQRSGRSLHEQTLDFSYGLFDLYDIMNISEKLTAKADFTHSPLFVRLDEQMEFRRAFDRRLLPRLVVDTYDI